MRSGAIAGAIIGTFALIAILSFIGAHYYSKKVNRANTYNYSRASENDPDHITNVPPGGGGLLDDNPHGVPEATPFLLDQTGMTGHPLEFDGDPSMAEHHQGPIASGSGDPHLGQNTQDPVSMQNVAPSANLPDVVEEQYGFSGLSTTGGGAYGYLPVQLHDTGFPDPFASPDDLEVPPYDPSGGGPPTTGQDPAPLSVYDSSSTPQNGGYGYGYGYGYEHDPTPLAAPDDVLNPTTGPHLAHDPLPDLGGGGSGAPAPVNSLDAPSAPSMPEPQLAPDPPGSIPAGGIYGAYYTTDIPAAVDMSSRRNGGPGGRHHMNGSGQELRVERTSVFLANAARIAESDEAVWKVVTPFVVGDAAGGGGAGGGRSGSPGRRAKEREAFGGGRVGGSGANTTTSGSSVALAGPMAAATTTTTEDGGGHGPSSQRAVENEPRIVEIPPTYSSIRK